MKNVKRKILLTMLFLILIIIPSFSTFAAPSVIIYGPKRATVEVGRKIALNYTTNPRASRLTYSIRNTRIASVNNKGEIIGKASGSTILYVKAARYRDYGPASIAVPITVVGRTQNITGTSWVKVTVNKSLQMQHKSSGTRHYYSMNPNVAQVSRNGLVTGISSGVTTIVVTADATKYYNRATKRVKVTVYRAGQSLNYSPTSLRMMVGDQKTISARARTAISYTSSNPSVAMVNSAGKVTAKNPGSAYICVRAVRTARYNSVYVRIPVTVVNRQLSEKTLRSLISKKGTIGQWAFDDFDGNGYKEAFAVTLKSKSTKIDKIYFINSAGKIKTFKFDYGYQAYQPGAGSKPENIMRCGTKAFFYTDYGPVGSSYRTLLLGVKNGNPYELTLSRKIMGIFHVGPDRYFTCRPGEADDKIYLVYNAAAQQFTLGDPVDPEDLK